MCDVVLYDQTIKVTAPENDATDGVGAASVTGGGSGPQPFSRAASCPPSSTVVNSHEPEMKHLKSIIKKSLSNGNTSTSQSGFVSSDAAAPAGTEQASAYTKQASVTSKTSTGSDRRGLRGQGCCIISWLCSHIELCPFRFVTMKFSGSFGVEYLLHIFRHLLPFAFD